MSASNNFGLSALELARIASLSESQPFIRAIRRYS
jgi:hypothetical protein